jgi:mitogen-activated protein kinase 15
MSGVVDPVVLERFEIIKKLGKGAYGVVFKAIDLETKKPVALKKIFDAF